MGKLKGERVYAPVSSRNRAREKRTFGTTRARRLQLSRGGTAGRQEEAHGAREAQMQLAFGRRSVRGGVAAGR